MTTITGSLVAIITPMHEDGSLDLPGLRKLVDYHVQEGTNAIVVVGTTGESPTLDVEEHIEVVRTSVEVSRGRLHVIAGTGANSTAEAIHLTKRVLDLGCQGTLQVTPYYNKPTPEGLYRHFSAVADLGLPVVLYNVPGRSGRDIPVETIVRLAKHPKVVAVKEAGGSVERVSAIRNACGITVLSGDDGLTLPMMSVGAQGVISVASNVAPREVSEMVRLALAGDFAAARQAHARLYPLFRDLFLETNPIPVKAALAMQGRIDEVYRLPLCEPSEKVRAQLRQTLAALGILP